MNAPRHITDAGAATALFAPLAHSPIEIAVAAYLDPNWRLLGTTQFTGTAGRVTPPIRTIVRDALSVNATALILAHVHPSGDPDPSPADLAYTRRLATTLRAIDMTLLDHLILTRAATTSLRELGLL